jgi:hypothetical protein
MEGFQYRVSNGNRTVLGDAMNMIDFYLNKFRVNDASRTMRERQLGLDSEPTSEDDLQSQAETAYGNSPYGNTIQGEKSRTSFYENGKPWVPPVKASNINEYYMWQLARAGGKTPDAGETGYFINYGNGKLKYYGPRGSNIIRNLTTYGTDNEEDNPKTMRKMTAKAQGR